MGVYFVKLCTVFLVFDLWMFSLAPADLSFSFFFS
jgi:hypothetical protein